MHDCRKTKKNLVDLIFGELETDQQQRALAEVRSCPVCSANYQAMLAALHVFDQSADTVMPDENYWTGYEARLRARLAEPASSKRLEWLTSWFASLLARPTIPVAIAAGLLLIAAISVTWASRQQRNALPALAVKATPTPQPAPTTVTSTQTSGSQNEILPEQRSTVAVKPRQVRNSHPLCQEEKPAASTPDDFVAANDSPVTAPASHFEKAQLLLRSFRNARAEGKGSTLDLAYEKREAGKLIYDNILLRREAEAKGQLPVEEALNSLEPLLLDIANLPDKPSRGEVQVIRERIQKQEIIATLQIVSSGTERFSLPVLLNPQ